MLLEEQTAKLLQQCEEILGIELRTTRGNLRKAESRAAAVWELLVIDAASRIGSIEYEPDHEGSPDIRLQIQGGRAIWLEATYLYPRFWDEERRSNAMVAWLFAEAKRRGIPMWKISPRLDGIQQGQKGPIRVLPLLQEKRRFLKHHEVVKFFEGIVCHPHEPRTCTLSPYTVSLSYLPDAQPQHMGWGGLAQEAPTSVTEQAVYLKLKAKAKQHDVAGPRLVCIGSDQSPALSRLLGSRTGMLSAREAAAAAFSAHPSLSAAIIVAIENRFEVGGGLRRQARAELLCNPIPTDPLTPEEVRALCMMDFNRWTYTRPLEPWESPKPHISRRATGALVWRPGAMRVEIAIPVNIVVDALAGKTSIPTAFELAEDDEVTRVLNKGWSIVSCRLIEAKLESGEAAKLILELVPPMPPVYWPGK